MDFNNSLLQDEISGFSPFVVNGDNTSFPIAPRDSNGTRLRISIFGNWQVFYSGELTLLREKLIPADAFQDMALRDIDIIMQFGIAFGLPFKTL